MAVSGGTKGWSRPEVGKMPAWKLEVLERKRQKMAAAAVAPGTRGKGEAEERLVLQDSLGPLRENPFMKREQERRRRRPHLSQQPPVSPPGSLRQLLDLYDAVPGIRTIRADNIIIIESEPGFFPPGPPDPLDELLAKRGSKVAEIRASEVVVYEPAEPPRAELPEHRQLLDEAGRVSRLLEKFDRGHGRPLRSRSWDNLLDGKPPLSPKPLSAPERHSQAPPSGRVPKRPGDLSPVAVSLLDEDSKRFPLNNPSWLPSKPPAVHSLPDPELFQKRPSSPMASPTSPRDEKALSPIVATVREKFEPGHTGNNHPLSKLVGVAQKTDSNTVVVNPKAATASKTRSPDKTKDPAPLTNGHVSSSELNATSGSSINIHDLLSKSKRPRGTAAQPLAKGPVPSNDSSHEPPKGVNAWRPKSEVNHPKSNIPPKSSATPSQPSQSSHCDQASTSATASQQLKVSASTSSNDSFEIKAAPKPDLSSIPDHDIQAKALANIRMQSKNSFIFIPKKRQDPPVQDSAKHKPNMKTSASTLNGPKFDSVDSAKSGREDRPNLPLEALTADGTVHLETLQASKVPLLSDFDWKSGLLPSRSTTEGHSFTDPGAALEYISSLQDGDGLDVLTVPVTNIHEDVAKPDIPITNIDDIVALEDREVFKDGKPPVKVVDSLPNAYRPHVSLSSTARGKGGNTFTVVPKRRPVSEQEAFRSSVVDDGDDDDEASSKRKSSDGSEAPFSELGALLKKRYPTVEEIQVIGGYQSLSRSCLLKNGSTRKKMKISFNDGNIHTMFEYPSETSLAEEMGEETDEVSGGSDSEDEDKNLAIYLPRPTFTSAGAPGNSLRVSPANSGLSNYTPKHSMEYSQWQDEKPPAGSSTADSSAEQGNMLTPADSSDHTDFRSEPALYF